MKTVIAIAAVLLGAAGFYSTARAETTVISAERADGEMLSAAQGHYARARHFTLKAVKEFNLGVRSVDPQAVLDVDQWRNTLMDRSEDLERVLTLQPMANQQGVAFRPAPRLVNNTYLQPAELTKKGVPIEEAKGEPLMIAINHYVQARDLLLTAIREFDAALKLANPQVLLDVHEWRNSVLDRAEDLDRVVAPKPRESEKGVAYPADGRLINEAFK